MSLINNAENLIRIHPPIPWADIENGPELVALQMLFDIPEGADPLDADERWQATGISAVGGKWSTSYRERQLQKVVDHYVDHSFSGHIEVRSEAEQGTAAWRIVVRGKHVVRLSAVLGWPPEQADDSEDGLMEILAGHSVYVGDEIDPGDHRNPFPGYRPADETDLPDALLAWRDAAVQTATASLGLKDEYGILDHGGGLRSARTEPIPLADGNAAVAVELRAKGIFDPESRRPASLMRRKATDWEEIPADVTPDDIMPGYSGRKAAAAREGGE